MFDVQPLEFNFLALEISFSRRDHSIRSTVRDAETRARISVA